MTDIAFEHFDPELELGNLDENGRPIRPRKKPGRKPNPPSPAQRKAQNRAAQRAFRERKRREMREAEATVKRALYVRDQALRQASKLDRKVKELEYENNHLRGHILTLKLACTASRVDVPNFADTGSRDDLGAERLMSSKSKAMSQALEFFLDKSMHIISLQDEHLPADLMKSPPSFGAIDSPSPSTSFSSNNNITTYSTGGGSGSGSSSSGSTLIDTLLMSPQILHNQRAMPGSFEINDFAAASSSQPLPPLDLTQTATVLAPQLQALNSGSSYGLDPALFQQLASTDLVSSFIDQVTRPNFTIDQTPPELAALIPPEWRSSLQSFSEKGEYSKHQLKHEFEDSTMSELWNTNTDAHRVITADQQTSTSSTTTTTTTSDSTASTSTITNDVPETTKTYTIGPDGERVYHPMTPLEFVTEMRKIQRTDKNTLAFFEPTELQRNVRHDIRIDAVPGASMRDHMIMFQDYYDANELFNMLIGSAMFLGGCPGNQDNWFVPPSFIRKYWFLCPSTKPQRLDNSVEIAVYLSQRMQDMMLLRKQMFFEREKYLDHFPTPAAIEEHDQSDDFSRRSPSHEDDMMIEATGDDPFSDNDSNSEDTFFELSDDIPINMMLEAVESMPRLISPRTVSS
ncbi:hypothetical protein BDB00DRAFT_874190 [Zychaea mexicana]|uniref:uncharacterized protein n=1 Tax=Zychaea mexicana TaxID=64656 RepID=UPI0022FE3144|nr:uncharacterized protein BDB00DRAFT_874190 [Zychaea mexicana]KAI9491627.1 hypothetical protein BDB00DRAFT_874190 [Zychaea mexicana]